MMVTPSGHGRVVAKECRVLAVRYDKLYTLREAKQISENP